VAGTVQRELVERAAQGDQEAFATLATQHVDRCRIVRDSYALRTRQQAL
jgi:hypothetical protein